MSKKQANSEPREVELPEWADEVTPSDEVMRKFYAPTGAFRPGPISPPEPPAPDSDISHVQEPFEQPSDPPAEPEIAPEPAPEPPAPFNLTPAPEQEAPPQAASLPPPKLKRPRGRPRKTAPTQESSVQAQHPAFEEFARRWSRYLYTGQLAVMRELYQRTIARGTTDCFTSYNELATATKMTRRNCIYVVNSLIDQGFVEKLGFLNDATGKGTFLRVHTHPQI